MAKSSDSDGPEPTTDHGQLDRSVARERDLATRYRHIRSHMNVTQALEKLGGIENAGFQDLLAQLADLGVIIGVDALLPRHLARRQERFGLTLVLPGHEPLIWLNSQARQRRRSRRHHCPRSCSFHDPASRSSAAYAGA